MRVGIRVQCGTCGLTKAPIGRSISIGRAMCQGDTCRDYYCDPQPGSLWPGETEEEFGFPVSADGTKEVQS